MSAALAAIRGHIVRSEHDSSMLTRSILVVDDEAAVRHILKRKLEDHGYSVHEAGDGNAAIAALQTHEFDLVITDIVMPERDGIETICYIRKEQPRVKVIAISAPSNKLFLESACGLGASCAFEKPLSLADLAHAVDDLLSAPESAG